MLSKLIQMMQKLIIVKVRNLIYFQELLLVYKENLRKQ